MMQNVNRVKFMQEYLDAKVDEVSQFDIIAWSNAGDALPFSFIAPCILQLLNLHDTSAATVPRHTRQTQT